MLHYVTVLVILEEMNKMKKAKKLNRLNKYTANINSNSALAIARSYVTTHKCAISAQRSLQAAARLTGARKYKEAAKLVCFV